MKQVNQVGVDVGSEALVCMMKRAGQPLPLATFANTAAGHKKFIRWATKGARSARVCLEATGIYSLEFALALHHAKNVEVMVVNPRAIKDFVRACMQRAKTDAVGRVRRERSMFTMSLAPVLRVRMLRSVRGRRRAGACSRNAAEQRAGYQPGAAWIVEVEQAADHFT